MVCLVFALGTRKGCIENRGSPSDSTRAGGNVSDDSDGDDDDDGGDADDDEATDSSGVNI